jgi:hypothetical protein
MTRPRPGLMMFDTSMIAILIVLAIFTLGITAWAAWENWPISWRVRFQGDRRYSRCDRRDDVSDAMRPMRHSSH